jgi:type II secretory pathway pseudopilin PulG
MIKSAKSGYTVIELVVILGIIAVLGGIITPLALNIISAKREQATREELKTIKQAIIGEAKKTADGEEFTFGFVGDVGNIPTTLDELKSPGALPDFSFDIAKNMGAGWNGPYMMEQFGGDFKEDPYGAEYIYSTAGYTNTDLGVDVKAKITSVGPDRAAGTTDDLSIEILEPEVRADIIGLVKNRVGLGIPFVDVTINYPSNGSLTMAATQTDSEGVYLFSDIPLGDRAVIVKPEILYESNTAVTKGKDGKDVEFVVTNYSENAIAISSLTATYSSDPVAYYKEIKLNGVSVHNSDNPRTGSGDMVTFGPVPMSASSLAAQPYIIRIQGPKVEIPDVKISSLGAGGSLTIELKDFKDAPTGGADKVDMTGTPFEVTFSNGSVVAFVLRREK